MFKKMIQIIFISLFLLVACGREMKYEDSEIMYEEGIVEKIEHTEDDIEVRFEPWDPNFRGIPQPVIIPEEFKVVFRYKFGHFATTKKEFYERFKYHKGEKVIISYCEVYKVVYDTTDGKNKIISREFVDYRFVNAILK